MAKNDEFLPARCWAPISCNWAPSLFWGHVRWVWRTWWQIPQRFWRRVRVGSASKLMAALNFRLRTLVLDISNKWLYFQKLATGYETMHAILCIHARWHSNRLYWAWNTFKGIFMWFSFSFYNGNLHENSWFFMFTKIEISKLLWKNQRCAHRLKYFSGYKLPNIIWVRGSYLKKFTRENECKVLPSCSTPTLG